jgi:hypothetical protein
MCISLYWSAPEGRRRTDETRNNNTNKINMKNELETLGKIKKEVGKIETYYRDLHSSK